MGPEVMAGAHYPQGGLLAIRRFEHAAGLPGIDLAAGEQDAAALNSSPAIHRVGVRDLLVHRGRRDAKGLQADVIVHLDGVEPLGVRALRALFASLVESPLGTGLVEPGALGVERVAQRRDHLIVRDGHAGAGGLRRGELGESLDGRAGALVGHQHADGGDVTVGGGTRRVVRLHWQIHHT